MLLKALKVVRERLAERVLRDAHTRKLNDDRLNERVANPAPGPASGLADKIDEEIKAAHKEGVEKNHPKLMEAEKIAKALREADNLRKRLANRQNRLEKNKR